MTSGLDYLQYYDTLFRNSFNSWTAGVKKTDCFITLTWAQTLNGYMNEFNQRVQRFQGLRISNQETMILTHHLRRLHDAILVGVNTVLIDDCKLTVRLVPSDRNPQPLILDPHLKTPLGCQLMKGFLKPWIIALQNSTLPSSWQAKYDQLILAGAKIILLEARKDSVGFDLVKLTETLSSPPWNIKSIMVEGGPTTLQHFINAELMDVVVVTIGETKTDQGGQKVNHPPFIEEEHGFATKLDYKIGLSQIGTNKVVHMTKTSYHAA